MAAQSRSQALVRFMWCATLILTCMLAPRAQTAASGSTQGLPQENRQITKKNLLDSLEAGADPAKRMTTARYIEWIRGLGVKFRVTPADDRRIRKVGKYLGAPELDKLVAALHASYRPPTSMSGRVEQVKVLDNRGGGVQVFVQFTVRNYGPPTVAQKFTLRIMHATMANLDVNALPMELNELVTVTEGGAAGEVVIRPEDALALNTRQAIRSGTSATGWLRFYLPLLPDLKPSQQLKPEFLRQPGIWYVVSFADASGELYEAVYEVN